MMNKAIPIIKKRHAQVTIYIIIGTFLAIILMYLIMTNKFQILDKNEQEIIQQSIDPQVAPVQNFITSCLLQTAKQGIKQVGESGGYLDVPLKVNEEDPTQGDGLIFSPGSNVRIPYYWHLSSRNDCTACSFKNGVPILHRPAKNSVESRIDGFISKNIRSCLGNFEGVRQDGTKIIENGRPNSISTITKKSVIVVLNYSIVVIKNNKRTELNNFVTELPVRLGEIHEFASVLTALEANHSYLEKDAIQLIGLYGGSYALPPMNDITFELGSGKSWHKPLVAKMVTDLLTQYIPLLQVFGTSNFKPIPAKNQNEEIFLNRNMLILTSLDKGWPNLEANFAYLDWWRPYFDLNCAGSGCKPDNLVNTILPIPFAIQRYQFQYDLSFPVVITLTDPDAFGGEGFSYFFALEANLRNNKPLKGVFRPNEMIESSQSILCNANTVGPIQLNVFNTMTKDIVDDVSVTYTCGDGEYSESCFIANNGSSMIKLPRCIGGILVIEKSGYRDLITYVDTDESVPELDLYMQPLRTIDLNVERYRLVKGMNGSWFVRDNPISLASDEEAMITVTPEDDSSTTVKPVVAFVLGDFIAQEQYGSSKVELGPGIYDVQIMITKRPINPIVIPSKERCFDGKCLTLPVEDIRFDSENPLISGGGHYKINLTTEELMYADSIIVYAIDVGLDLVPRDERIPEDLGIIGSIDTYFNQGLTQFRVE